MTDTKKEEKVTSKMIKNSKGELLEHNPYPLKKEIVRKKKTIKPPKEIWLTKEGATFLKSKGYI